MRRHLGTLDAAALFAGIVLGSGIFVAPAAVHRVAGGGAGSALLWAAGGLVCLCGALTYAEAAARVPRTGGFYAFYREALGERAAFVGAWAALAVTYPASVAVIATIFALHAREAFGLAGESRVLGAAAIAAGGAIAAAGLRTGPAMQRLLTALKVAALAALCVAAAAAATGPSPGPDAPAGAGSWLGGLLLVLWTYEGWSDVTLVAGEVRDPSRTLSRATILGTGILVALYLVVQVSVEATLGGATAASERPVAEAVARSLGPGAGKGVAILVAVSTFGSILGVVWTTARLALAMGEGGVLPSTFGATHPSRGTPDRATALVVAVSIVYVVSGGLQALLSWFAFAVWIFYGAAAVSLLLLRRRGVGEVPRPGPLPAVAPWVVLVVGAVVTASVFAADPKRSLAGLALLAAGFPLHALIRYAGTSATPR